MPRPRKKNLNLPPRMHIKGSSYYYVVRGTWTPLGQDLNQARVKWAAMENDGTNNQNLFSVALDTYLAKIMQNRAENTIRAYMSRVQMLRDVFGHMRLEEIQPSHIAQFIDTHPRVSIAKMCKAIISSTFTLAIRAGLVRFNPCQVVRMEKTVRRDRYITNAEFYAIRDNADELLIIAMDLAYLTGMRISDVLKVKLSDITEDGLVVTQKKTGKRQIFTITPSVRKVLDFAKSLDRPIGSFFLIPNHKGQAFERRVFYFHWQNACRKAGVENARFHDLRGKSATDAKGLGQDYQALLGHSSRKQSDDYIKSRSYDKVSPLDVILEESKINRAK